MLPSQVAKIKLSNELVTINGNFIHEDSSLSAFQDTIKRIRDYASNADGALLLTFKYKDFKDSINNNTLGTIVEVVQKEKVCENHLFQFIKKVSFRETSSKLGKLYHNQCY